MELFQDHLLSIIIFSPLLAAFFLLLMPGDSKNLIRRLAFVFSLITLGLILYAWFEYDRTQSGLQFEEIVEWFPSIGSSYHVAIDGISLTVNEVRDDCFSVNIIPYTASQTTLTERRPGDKVNIEADILGKYLERLVGKKPQGKIDAQFLSEHGFL